MLCTVATHAAKKPDSLRQIYSNLKVGMTMADTLKLATKYYPNCKLKDTDIWDHEYGTESVTIFSWLLVVDSFEIDALRNSLARVTLRIDFDKKTLQVVNAIYVREKDKKTMLRGLKTGIFAKAEERLALVGDGYYAH